MQDDYRFSVWQNIKGMWAYHLNLSEEEVKNARLVLLPGDPARVPKIAKRIDLESQMIAAKREYHTYLGSSEGKHFLVTSTGIGGPSTSIAVDELAQLGLKTFIRVGTTGGIQRNVRVGDVVITTGAVRLEGASSHYAPIEYPAVAHFELVALLREAAKKAGVRYHIGITASSDTFYPGQERKDSFSGYIPRKFQGQTEELTRLNVLNYEMEAATLLTMSGALGLYAACFCGVADNRFETERVSPEALALAEENVLRVAEAFVPLFFLRFPEGMPE